MDDLIEELKAMYEQSYPSLTAGSEVAEVVAKALERIDARLKAMEQSVMENDARHATY